MKEYTAIEITSPKVAELLTTLDTTMNDLDYHEDLHLNFLVLGFPTDGKWALVKADQLKGFVDHITPGITITLKQFHIK